MKSERIATLPAVEAAIWHELARAVRDKQHGWRIGVLATVDEQPDGPRPEARNVVLRELDEDARELLIFTDARSPKARQSQAHPIGMLVLWAPLLGWQLRLRVQLSMQTTGLAVSSRWARLKTTAAAADYLSTLPPGSPLPTPAPACGSREYFAVLTAGIGDMDWLELSAQGHRRAAFSPGQEGRWIAP
jgi:hypothetical protein